MTNDRWQIIDPGPRSAFGVGSLTWAGPHSRSRPFKRHVFSRFSARYAKLGLHRSPWSWLEQEAWPAQVVSCEETSPDFWSPDTDPGQERVPPPGAPKAAPLC